MAVLRRLAADDLPRLRAFWAERWGGEEMIVHGETFRPEAVEGFATPDWRGLVTLRIQAAQCEILSLDSLDEDQGTGAALLQAAAEEARRRQCTRLFLSTTNDNLRALAFYQRRGFRIRAVRPGAVDQARRLKPGIARIGLNRIPLRDEIELELDLRQAPGPSAAV